MEISPMIRTVSLGAAGSEALQLTTGGSSKTGEYILEINSTGHLSIGSQKAFKSPTALINTASYVKTVLYVKAKGAATIYFKELGASTAVAVVSVWPMEDWKRVNGGGK